MTSLKVSSSGKGGAWMQQNGGISFLFSDRVHRMLEVLPCMKADHVGLVALCMVSLDPTP